jgi:hypothetical protein
MKKFFEKFVHKILGPKRRVLGVQNPHPYMFSGKGFTK